MGEDPFHCPRLLYALPSRALDTARDIGAATAALGTVCQGLNSPQPIISSQYPTYHCPCTCHTQLHLRKLFQEWMWVFC